MAHSLSGYDGACREIHGHSYKLFVTVQGEPNADPNNPKYGMVMDFGELKRIVGRLIVDPVRPCVGGPPDSRKQRCDRRTAFAVQQD